MSKVVITGQDLTVEQIVAVCRECAPLELSEETKKSVLESRQIVDDLIAEEKVVYGITTGFGKFSNFTGSVQRLTEKPDYHTCGWRRQSIYKRYRKRNHASSYQ